MLSGGRKPKALNRAQISLDQSPELELAQEKESGDARTEHLCGQLWAAAQAAAGVAAVRAAAEPCSLLPPLPGSPRLACGSGAAGPEGGGVGAAAAAAAPVRGCRGHGRRCFSQPRQERPRVFETTAGLFTLNTANRVVSSGVWKVLMRRDDLRTQPAGIIGNFFAERVVEHWKRLPWGDLKGTWVWHLGHGLAVGLAVLGLAMLGQCS